MPEGSEELFTIRNALILNQEIQDIKFSKSSDILKKLDEFHKDAKEAVKYLEPLCCSKDKISSDNLRCYVGYGLLAYTFFNGLKKQIKNVQQSDKETLKIAKKSNSSKLLVENTILKVFNVNDNGDPILSGNDVLQDNMHFGDCWLLSTLRALAEKNPEVILKCFKTIPDGGVWSKEDGPITVRLNVLDQNNNIMNKKMINVDPTKFLEGVNSYRKDNCPIWPRILEIAAQSCTPRNFLKTNKHLSLNAGFEGATALKILGGQKYINIFGLGVETDSDNNQIKLLLNQLSDILKENRSFIICEHPNLQHQVILDSVDINNSSYKFLDQHDGKVYGPIKILSAKEGVKIVAKDSGKIIKLDEESINIEYDSGANENFEIKFKKNDKFQKDAILIENKLDNNSSIKAQASGKVTTFNRDGDVLRSMQVQYNNPEIKENFKFNFLQGEKIKKGDILIIGIKIQNKDKLPRFQIMMPKI